MNGMGGFSAALLALFALALSAGETQGNELLSSEEARNCLVCHAKTGLTFSFQDGDSSPAFVDAAAFRGSAHGALACSACHDVFSAQTHPQRRFASRERYRIKASLACRRCHTDEQIKQRPVHAGLLLEEREGKPALCANCHGSHAVARISGEKTATSEERYCLRCHERRIVLSFANGDRRPAVVDVLMLKSSVHARLDCSDCHYGFSSEEHPRRAFRTGRDFTLASSESCRRCHFDKYTKALEGIHYRLLSQGQLKAPVCVDCHGSHEISHASRERAAGARRCQRCHARQYEVYSRSVHGSALINEHNQDVPVCVDCHTAHTIEDPFSLDYRERIPEMCSSCHSRKDVAGRYGLSTNVVKTYLSDFHGVTLGLYRLQGGKQGKPIAVCTDCHGTHNITSTAGPDATVVKANLVKRCQKCHRDANRNFPDAWLSHYEPSMKRAPLVYLAGLAYEVFIPVLLIGLALQILLHLWRYAINR